MDNLCRTCGKSSKDALASIFLASRYTLKFADMIKECTSVNISSPDELPKLICIDCQNRLEISFSFKRQCLEIDEKLKDMGINSKSFQDEPDYFNTTPIQVKQEVNFSYDNLDNNSTNDAISEFENTENSPEDQDEDVKTDFDEIYIPDNSFDNNSDSSENDNFLDSDDNSETENPSQTDERSLNCNYCDRTFSSNTYLRTHMTKMHHPENCVRCCKPFDTPEIIPEHMKTHEGDINPCTCYVCGKAFNVIRNLREHVKAHHMDSAKRDHILKCEECNEDFSSYQSFELHVKKKHPGIQLKCEYCDMCFASEKGLPIHIRTKHIKHVCGRCLLNCDTKDKLIEHQKTHSNDPLPFKCLKCGKYFDARTKFKKHLWLHLVKNPECVCPICDKYFPQKYILMQHVRLSHLFRNRNKNLTRKPKCGACHKRFDTKKILLEHLQSVHKQETVACGQCDSSFPNKILLNAHIAKSHDFQCRRCLLKCYSQDKLDEHINIHENNPAKFICRHCGKGFSTVTHLVRHLRIHTGEKPNICQFCGKSFSDATNLTVHVRTHTGEKPFKCTICDKKFSQWSTLNTHRSIHDGEKRFNCQYCGLKYTLKSSLQIHIRSKHLGLAKKYHCNVCGKTINARGKLEHLRTHSGETPHKCPVCNRGFNRADNLKTHMKTHSGTYTDTHPVH